MRLRILTSVMVAACTVLSACATSIPSSSTATDSPLGGLLNSLGGKKNDNSGSQSDSGSGSGLGGIVGGLIGGLISTDNVDTKSMTGTWAYSSPAVCFKSENLLKKAGGSAVAAAAEGKLVPYYQKLGLTKLVLTINDDMSFTMKSGVLTASGTIEKDDNGDILFHFKALKSINIGTMKAYVTMTAGRSMSLMFDVSKLISIIKGISSVAGSSTIKSVSSLLESYDGVCAGFKLSKQ
ncbi:hypothetical protein IMSAGC006_00071 [Muribaculaceae bacterium]|nr:hypothetical protein IMSAGC006_00071 [Muribaculaceae bacterium]